ncbi:MAG: NADH-quinone oxidoreductase subunit A [Chthoniobacterales bacterium]
MLKDYAPVLLHVLVAIGFATVTLALNLLLGRRGRRNATKETSYECGVIPEVDKHQPRFSVKFYLVAMLFILFDIEIVFMYPWAVAFAETIKANGELILGSMALFVTVLLIGYIYAIKKGALDWSR